MNRAEAIFPAAILLVVATLVAIGFFVIQYRWVTLIFPLIVGIAVCVLCLIELARQYRGSGVTAGAGEEALPPLSPPSLFWMFALIVFLYGLGFVFGAAAYLLACLRANGFSWRVAGGVAAASLLVTWGLFIKVIHVLLPIAPLWMS